MVEPDSIVLKKNGKIRVCVDYRKLNGPTVTDTLSNYTTITFPLPFTDGVLDAVAGHEVYNFLDGFIRYNQIRIQSWNGECSSW